MSDTGAEAVKSDHAILGRAIPGVRAPMTRMNFTESRSVVQLLRIPSVIRPDRRTSAVVAK